MVRTRLRNSRKSITGTGERRVLAANPAAAATVTAQQTLVATEPQPQSGPLTRPREAAPTPMTSRKLPSRSGMRVELSRVSFRATLTTNRSRGAMKLARHKAVSTRPGLLPAPAWVAGWECIVCLRFQDEAGRLTGGGRPASRVRAVLSWA